ncbi:MAG: hypothetical protein ACI90V_012863, partial [Bacillariaceae sp.]
MLLFYHKSWNGSPTLGIITRFNRFKYEFIAFI